MFMQKMKQGKHRKVETTKLKIQKILTHQKTQRIVVQTLVRAKVQLQHLLLHHQVTAVAVAEVQQQEELQQLQNQVMQH